MGTTKFVGRVNFLCTLLCGEALREFENPERHNNGSTESHLKEIQEVLIEYPPPTNAIRNQKRSMFRSMKKPRAIPMKRLVTRFTELKNFRCSS